MNMDDGIFSQVLNRTYCDLMDQLRDQVAAHARGVVRDTCVAPWDHAWIEVSRSAQQAFRELHDDN
jgi:hypothetical protein